MSCRLKLRKPYPYTRVHGSVDILFLLTWLSLILSTNTLFAQSTGPFPHLGKLIIIGGGTIPDTIFHLFAESMGGKDRSMVVIPTATSDDEYIAAGGHLKKFSERGFTNLQTIHTRERKRANDKAFLESIKGANGLFFGGGDQQKMADAYADTRLHAEMRALLDRGGVIMGTSAGASIMGSLLMGGDHRKNPHIPAKLPAGLGFMQHTAIDQHVLVRNRQFDLLPIMKSDTTLLGIAIDESTAAVVEGNILSVAGDSYVLIYDRAQWKQQEKAWGDVHRPFLMLRQGQRYDLAKHEVLK